jgi:hypothetical protein
MAIRHADLRFQGRGSYQLDDSKIPFSAAIDCVVGYHKVNPLLPEAFRYLN